MKKTRRPMKKWIWWIIVPAVLIAGALMAFVILLGSAGESVRYDDAEEILRGFNPSEFRDASLAPDGTLTLRLEKPELYYYAERCGFREQIRERIESQSGMEGARFGFRIADGQIIVYLSSRLWGHFDVSYRAVLSELGEGSELRFHTEKVFYGSGRELTKKNWPALFQTDFVLELTETDILDGITDAYPEDDALLVISAGLRLPAEGTLTVEPELLTAFSLFGRDESTDERLYALLEEGTVDMAEALPLLLEAKNVPAAYAELLRYGTGDSLAALWTGRSELFRRFAAPSVENAAAEGRAELIKLLGSRQAGYEKLLSAVRELYKSGGLRVDFGSFSVAATKETFDPTGLFSHAVTALDSRIVFLTAGEDSSELCLSDVPKLDSIPISDKHAFRNMDRRGYYDLGYLVTTESGRNVLLHLNADGEFVLREISGDRFVAALLQEENPILCINELEEPAVTFRHEGSAEWNASVIELL